MDAPISNSGRLKTYLREIAERESFNWEIHLVNNPDKELIESDKIMISSDAWILEDGKRWFNFMGYIIEHNLIRAELFFANKPKKIALVTCVKEKQGKKTTAKDLYQGELFRKFMSSAESFSPDKTFILSGKHGLLKLEDEIEPYDLNLNVKEDSYQREWARNVMRDLKKETDILHDEFIFITNPVYCKYLIPNIRNYKIPLKIK